MCDVNGYGDPTRGLVYPQFKARQPSDEARSAELGRRLWDISESFVQEAFDDLDEDENPRMMMKNSTVERLTTGARTGSGAGASSTISTMN